MSQKVNVEKLVIDGQTYVREDSIKKMGAEVSGMQPVLIRTYSAGVHFGYLEKREGKEVTLRNSRRVWYWKGAASLSQIAIDGVNAPSECKFTVIVPEITLTEAIEVIQLTEKAVENLYSVPEWKQ